MNKQALLLLLSLVSTPIAPLYSAAEDLAERPSIPTEVFRCERCPQIVFYNPEAFALHVARHTGECVDNRCPCDCNQVFWSEWELDQHLCSIRFICPFSCALCRQRFAHRDACTEHQEEHFCRYCQEERRYFATTDEAREHEATQHGEEGQRGQRKRGLLDSDMREEFDMEIGKQESHRNKRRR